jgi:hypothetical protein
MFGIFISHHEKNAKLSYDHVISSFISILSSTKYFIGVTQIEMHGSSILLAYNKVALLQLQNCSNFRNLRDF